MPEIENVNENSAVQSVEQIDMSTDTKIAQLVVEIKHLKNDVGENIIKIGSKLLEIRELFKTKKKGERGSWGNWLKSNVDFTHQTANKFMQCAERFQNYAPARKFNSAQMFELLALPAGEKTIEFIEAKDNEGKSIADMKKLELREELKKWKGNKNESDSDTSTSATPESTDTKYLKELKRLFAASNALKDSSKFEILIQRYAEQHSDTLQADLKNLQELVNFLSDHMKSE